MNPLGHCKSPLETLSTSTAQANISNCCDNSSEQPFLFPSVKLKWQDKVAAYTRVVTSVGYIYLITTGELGSSLKHRDEPKLMLAGKPAPFQICHVDGDAMHRGLRYQWKNRSQLTTADSGTKNYHTSTTWSLPTARGNHTAYFWY